MSETQNVHRHAGAIAAVFLFVLPVFCFTKVAAQDKGDSNRSDQGRASQKAEVNTSEIRTSDRSGDQSAPDRTAPCTEKSVVSELGCSQLEPGGSARVLPSRRSIFPQGSPGSEPRSTEFWRNQSFQAGVTDPWASTAYRRSDSEDLMNASRQADDPIASMRSFTFETSYSPSLWGTKARPDQGQTTYRPVIPLSVMGTSNLLRVSLPYAGSGGLKGSGNVEVLDLFTFSQKWGHWGAGAVATFGASGGFGIDTGGAGPAVSLVAQKGGWLLGVLNKNVFGRNASVSSIQPVIAYQLGRGWSLSAGELQYQIDWNRGGFATVPAGFQVGKVIEHGSQYLRFTVGPQYNVRNIYGANKWTVVVGVTILLPGR